MNAIHHPVMLKECLDSIPFVDEGVYLDCTFGVGGHCRAVLDRMSADSHLYAIDRDEAAVSCAQALECSDSRLRFERANFADIRRLCAAWSIDGRVNAALADLGVSSPQLDDPRRGFAFSADSDLDMRMDRRVSPDAREWINRCEPGELRRVFKDLGQLSRPGALASAIARYRRKREITGTRQLADLVAAVEAPGRTRTHPATNAFRAIRMHINRELENLNLLLESAADILTVGGRLLLICFHSLEVRAVRAFLRQAAPRKLPVRLPVRHNWRLVDRLRPSATEVDSNPRARSACLYVVEKQGGA